METKEFAIINAQGLWIKETKDKPIRLEDDKNWAEIKVRKDNRIKESYRIDGFGGEKTKGKKPRHFHMGLRLDQGLIFPIKEKDNKPYLHSCELIIDSKKKGRVFEKKKIIHKELPAKRNIQFNFEIYETTKEVKIISINFID